ncbi:hypothetical protein EX30DRAFT_371516 [Ascodesmis nigricans]|uniref:F-box domain-containing protein n=1 Tax=Ascodesmis nigricans TaxID=341454 RepID=A0A4S2MXU8_9PEZI|nr:hypothetical protein EX30DRAFT_371516 [Ascodesmis nigricans]
MPPKTLLTLPPELLTHIASFLPPTTISRLRRCSRYLLSVLTFPLYHTPLISDQGLSLLDLSARSNNAPLLSRLLTFPAVLTLLPPLSRTLPFPMLHIAAGAGSIDVLRLLFSHLGPESFTTLIEQHHPTSTLTPLQHACCGLTGFHVPRFILWDPVRLETPQHVATVRYLVETVEADEIVEMHEWSPLHLAMRFGFLNTARWLLERVRVTWGVREVEGWVRRRTRGGYSMLFLAFVKIGSVWHRVRQAENAGVSAGERERLGELKSALRGWIRVGWFLMMNGAHVETERRWAMGCGGTRWFDEMRIGLLLVGYEDLYGWKGLGPVQWGKVLRGEAVYV